MSKAFEIVGTTASGKSTVTSGIFDNINGVRFGMKEVSRWQLVASALMALPVIVAVILGYWSRRTSGPLAQRVCRYSQNNVISEIKIVAHLSRFGFFSRENSNGFLLYDQGPTYMLAYLHYSGCIDSNEFLRRWSTKIEKSVAKCIDKIVFLKAPESVLVQRMKQKPNWREWEGHYRTDQMVKEFIELASQNIEGLIARFEGYGIPILIVNTYDVSPAQTVNKIVHFLTD